MERTVRLSGGFEVCYRTCMHLLYRHGLPVVALLLLIGCNGGPSPAAPEETPAAPKEGASAVAAPTGSGVVQAGHIEFQTPEGWTSHPTRTPMRRARFQVPGSAGDAELVVFYFGNQGAGSPRSNIDRWIGQFRNEDGSPITNAEVTDREIADFKVKQVEASGRYIAAMRPGAPERHDTPGQRMIAAIVETDGGPYYFKLVGPDATVQENRGAVGALLQSMRKSSGSSP